jgi:hypothetical protein
VIVLVVELESCGSFGRDLPGFVMPGHAFQINLALLLFLGLVLHAKVGDLDFAVHDLQSVLFSDLLPLELPVSRGKILDSSELAIDVLLPVDVFARGI